MFACDHNNLKTFHFSWFLMTSIQNQNSVTINDFEMILYYRCSNCLSHQLFPGNECKWIEKCRWTWTASGEIDSTVADISMLKTEMEQKRLTPRGVWGRDAAPLSFTSQTSCWIMVWLSPLPLILTSCYAAVISAKHFAHCYFFGNMRVFNKNDCAFRSYCLMTAWVITLHFDVLLMYVFYVFISLPMHESDVQ